MAATHDGEGTMSPDLAGRWQTRLVAFGAAGLVLTIMAMGGVGPGGRPVMPVLFLLYWLPVGLGLDIAYQAAQRLRREGDWPLLLGLYGLGLESLVVFGLMTLAGLPGLPGCLEMRQDLALRQAVCALPAMGIGDTLALLGIVVVATLLVQSIILPVLNPNWRFTGWRIIRQGRGRT
jgi:hypothetical protein